MPESIAGKQGDPAAQWLLCAPIACVIFLQKIAIPLGQHRQVSLPLLLILLAVALGMLLRRMEIRTTPMTFYLLMMAGIVISQLARMRDFSLLSLSLLLVMHLPYAFGARNPAHTDVPFAFFQKAMMMAALCGLLQFGLQFAVGRHYAFCLDTILPVEWIASGYNSLIPLHYGSDIYKSNGLFMLEPSIFSQFLALALIVEMVCFRRVLCIALYTGALLTTFSGTGLIMLAAVVPPYLIRQRRYALLAGLLLALGILIAIAPYIGLQDYTRRANEFFRSDTSGYARFFSIFPTLRDFILPSADTLLLGRGAGGFREVGEHIGYSWHAPSWGKILVEYGIIGALAYFPLLLYVFSSARISPYIKTAMAIQFLFLSEYVLSSTAHGLILAMLAWPKTAFEATQEEIANPGRQPTMTATG